MPPPARAPRFHSLFAQFAASGLAAVLLVAVGASLILRKAGERESVRDARRLTQTLGRTVVEPNLTEAVLQRRPAAFGRFDRLIRTRVLRAPVVRVKLWSADGVIVYSDKRELIGSRYGLEEDERNALAHDRLDAGISDLSRPENRFERPQRKLLEVYMPVETGRGTRLLFEAYLRYSDVAASGRHIWLTFAPAVVAALLLLWLAQMPLALSLVRRLRREHGERESLLLRALNASDGERRRIAGDLHDGVVQDLAGTSYELAVAAGNAAAAPREELADVLRHAASSTRQSMRRLRSLLVEIYPPNLRDAGLEAALKDLVEGAAGRGLEIETEISARAAPADTERLIYRTAQEALRNVVAHAGATRCSLSVTSEDGGIALLVRDNGRGFEPELAVERRASGHFGLRLLADSAESAGGTMQIHSAPGQGTELRLWLPT